MNQEFWLDGFNFFHCWEPTREWLRPGSGRDIARVLEQSLRLLGRSLGPRRARTLVFLDGGLFRCEESLGGLRVRYCGPGKKADDRMLADLGYLGDGARRVIAVSNDRELKGGLKAFGAVCLGVGEFLDLIRKGGDNGKAAGKRRLDPAEVLREKCRTLSAPEVSAWVDFFGGDVEA